MAGQVSRIRSATPSVAVPYSGNAAPAAVWVSQIVLSPSGVTAHSVEFVAKPGEALRAQSKLAASINSTLKEVTGFAGCMVMTSEQEGRLITVVTFWRGSDRAKHCSANIRWVNALLTPYVDRRLRVQTMAAQLPVVTLVDSNAERSASDAAGEEFAEQEEEICVAG